MDRSLATEIARKLSTAQHTREILPRISEQLPHASIDDAYEIQAAWVEEQLDAERKMAGHKIGLTARAAKIVAESLSLLTAQSSATKSSITLR